MTKKSIQVGWDWEKVEDLSYWQIPDGNVARLPHFIKKPPANVLDLGCGVGRHTVYFASIGYNVSAIDLSETAVKSTKEWLENEDLNALVEKSEMTTIPFEDNTFDLVLAFNVIYHAFKHDVVKTISEIERVLKPKGHLYLTILTKDPSIPFYGTGIVDDQTIIVQEGAEKGIPHFFFKTEDVFDLFKNFDFLDLSYKEWYGPPITLERVKDRKGNGHYILFAQKK